MENSMPTPTTSSAKIRVLLPIAGIGAIIILGIAIAGSLFFFRGKAIMEQQLKDKLRSTAAAAAMQFSGETIAAIRDNATMENSAALRQTVQKLQSIRENITNIHSAYIMRKTDETMQLEFVADADQSQTKEQLDRNKNGLIDEEEESPITGEKYNWTEFPALGSDGFLHPSVDEHIGEDQWGLAISGYAPIRRQNGQVVAVLGIDMDATEFQTLSTSIFSPIALLLILLASLCIGAGISLLVWRKRVESLERLEQERSGLLRLAFHQLGGPLTIITWSLEELEEEGPASLQHSISNIQEGVKRLTEILKTLKSADLVHTGKVEYKPEFGSLSTILEQVVKDAATKLAQRKQEVTMNLEENITMKLDPKLISGVAQELLANAIDFSKDGGHIKVESQRIGDFAEFTVIDRGCGIPKRDLSRIFGEFTRGTNATRFKADGNGLGLYIVKGIIEQAGGTIRVSSQEGYGTTVTVRLPIVA